MKRPVRLLLLGTVSTLGLLLVAGGLVLHSGVQTWAARRALAGQSRVKASVGTLSAGFRTVELHDVRLEQEGAVIEMPAFSAELSVLDAGWNQKVDLRRLVAKGWTLDLTRFAFPAGGMPAGTPPAAAPLAAAAEVFRGVFAQTNLPYDLTLDGVELEGDVVLPPAPGMKPGRTHLSIRGGGLGAGRDGVFTFTVDVNLAGADLPVTTLSVTGRCAAAMDTPRTFTRLTTRAEAAATGPKFPRGVKLAADLSAHRTASGEAYALTLSDGTRLLAGLQADWPSAGGQLSGTWKFDLRDTDLSPFTLGRALPAFALDGAGAFSADTATAEIHASGKLDAFADQLAVLQPELAALGGLRVVAEFDLARRGDSLRFERLDATLAGPHPVATVRVLQPFEFNAALGQLKVADPARELLGVVLQGVPLTWVRSWWSEGAIDGGLVRGELAAMASNGGFALRAKAPLAVDQVSVARAGQSWLRAVDVSLNPSADYTPQGWQAESGPLEISIRGQPLARLTARVGQLAGKNQPVKAAGSFTVNLPEALTQPFAAGHAALTQGRATGEFAASMGAKTEFSAHMSLSDLAVDPRLSREALPTIAADLRGEVGPGGVLTLTAPLTVERSGRKSDLTFAGTLTPAKQGYKVAARVTSSALVLQDVQPLSAPFSVEAPALAAGAAAPPWDGWSGEVTLALQRVIYADLVQLNDVTGNVRLEAGTVRLVNVKAGVGERAEAKLNGDLTFDARGPRPYGFSAEVVVSDFDPAPFFRAMQPSQPPAVEGRFTLASKLTASSANLTGLPHSTEGVVQVSSKSGVFRGLPVSYAAKAEASGRIAAGVAAVGGLLGSVTGKREAADIPSRAQAVAELARGLALIPYDQLNVVLARDAACNTVLRDFTLIAPELRLSGAGTIARQPGQGLLAGRLAMDCRLRARGRHGDLLRYLGVLEAKSDDLGYAACTLPVKLAGALGQPDVSDLNRALAALAAEKPGVTEKASELLNRLLGGGK